MAHATLNSAQLLAFSEHLVTGQESDTYLAMFRELYGANNWDTVELSELEATAAEVNALLILLCLEMTFEHYREGFVSQGS